MSVQSEINRIRQNIEKAYTSLKRKGVELPSEQVSDNLASTIDSINIAGIEYDKTSKTLTIVTNGGG